MRTRWSVPVAGIGLALVGCGGGSSPSNTVVPAPASTYTLGGSITGLTAGGLQLANGSDQVSPASGAASFTLPNAVASGTAYSVTVMTQPPHLNCGVTHGSGTIAAANVTSVQVACTPIAHSIGGTISGLSAGGLVLQNGGEMLHVSANATAFTFTTPVAETAAYAVSVATQPTGLNCSLSANAGTVGATNVTTVQVSCATLVQAATWSPPVVIGTGANPLLASDPSDTAFFVAYMQTGLAAPSPPSVAKASRFTDAAGWSAPVALGASNFVSGIGFDLQGNGYALTQLDTTTLAYSRYIAGSGWTGLGPLGQPNSGPPPVIAPNTTVYTQTYPTGLAVFGDGSATGLALEESRFTDSLGNSPHDDRPYGRMNASGNTGGVLTYGAVDPYIPTSTADGTAYQYTANGVTYQTRYYYPAVTFLPYDAMVQAPTAANYAIRYSRTLVTLNGQVDSNGNPLSDQSIAQGVVLWVGGSAHGYAFATDSVDSFAHTRFVKGSVAVSNSGAALVVWSTVPADRNGVSVYAMRFDGSSFTAPQVLYSASGVVTCGSGGLDYSCVPSIPVAAVDNSGNGIIFIPSVSGKTLVIRMDGKTGAYTTVIGPPAAPENNTAAQGMYAQALLDDAGNAYVMTGSGVFRIAAGASSFDAGGLAGPSLSSGGQMQLDRSGYPVAVWNSGNSVVGSRYH